jgi:2-polyprenyl-3-methyl-5-hydroxy-6-metoxy-1,4-benzoquinol methylase
MLTAIKPYVDVKRRGELGTPVCEGRQTERSRPSLLLGTVLRRIVERGFTKLGFEASITRRSASADRAARDSAAQDGEAPCGEDLEVRPVGLSDEVARVERAERLQMPNMVALSWAVATLVGPARRVAELGGGTGCFAHEAAADPARKVVCSDLDSEAIQWARANRHRPNIEYVSRLLTPDDGPFDLAVAIDLIEHIQDYASFLRSVAQLAPRAILTTPNKGRDSQSAGASPPEYYKHVRAWTAGEFYWVLKAFYRTVELYGMPNPYIPEVVPIRITDALTPVIAVCESPSPQRVGWCERE